MRRRRLNLQAIELQTNQSQQGVWADLRESAQTLSI